MSEAQEKTTGNLFVPKARSQKVTAEPREHVSNVIEIVHTLVLNVRMKHSYCELDKFVDEMMAPNEHLPKKSSGSHLSVLEQYAIESTHKAIDMSNQEERLVYRPNLCVQKTDAFGVWTFNYLIDLLELDYQCADEDKNKNFPKIWKTTSGATVQVVKDRNPTSQRTSLTTATTTTETAESVSQSDDDVTILCLLKRISLQNKCNENDAITWKDALEVENITTVQHLRTVAGDKDCWDKLSSVKYFVKQMIRDYIQLHTPSVASNRVKDPYKDSAATLYGDIHRVRRYFHDVTKTLEYIPYLDLEAVDLSIKEMRRTYEDDGKVLNTIHAYMRTFCLKPVVITSVEHDEKRKKWMNERARLLEDIKPMHEEHAKQHCARLIQQQEVELAELGYNNKVAEIANIRREQDEIRRRVDEMSNFSRDHAIQKLQSDYDRGITLAKKELDKKREILAKEDRVYAEISSNLTDLDMQIRDLDAFLKLNLVDEHQKLKVKYGRGLLLYGPPGTGKSELLKRAAVFAGITTITIPLAAGELNRSYVGETEKLLVDIMHRSDTIPHLISAMIIDEIDGLVPKRDNNAQQSKVDGISVLLSHIEGVKDIPNLIVLGATNRRNMMDEAFLRRMQGKCFVGRPSPKTREKMLQPLLLKDLRKCTSRHIDFLVRITTNFSGAAIHALRSSIVITLDQCQSLEAFTNHTLLTLADAVAREFSCWFGMETLPSIFRLYPNMNSMNNQQEYSLELPNHIASGRILVNLADRKCIIEFANEESSLELPLHPQETSTLTLLSRFINGCSSRNIDTIQIIDLNFLIKNNAFEENQMFELLTTLFLECDEYNRSMLIFDIDSLIMLTPTDSAMSKSVSISNIRLYQFIREKCKIAVVEQKQATDDVS
ncbi:unnamed protein product [Rotaria socialis]|uniref:AAA+ ATPase domain-containing protein n=1 Tax=Rotaria socialis TaxID=392032 RepID=A0A821PSV6_9BILA|nr:unnamed protein product [Rotaria socialis]